MSRILGSFTTVLVIMTELMGVTVAEVNMGANNNLSDRMVIYPIVRMNERLMQSRLNSIAQYAYIYMVI